jgi:hypothetical protein
MVGRLRPNSLCGACRPALGSPLRRFHILRQFASKVDSIAEMAVGDNAIKQCVCMILELAPYKSRHYFMLYGRGVDSIALLMLDILWSVNCRCAFMQSDAGKVVPWHPLGRVSSCDIIGIGSAF